MVTTPDPGWSSATIRDASTSERRRWEGDDGAAFRRERGATHEVDLAADAAVEAMPDRVGDDLAGEVDLDGRVDGRHALKRRMIAVSLV